MDKIKYIKNGSVVFGKYIGWDWCEDYYKVTAEGSTLEELESEVERITREETSEGSYVGNGYGRTCTSKIVWNKDIYKQELI